MGSTAGVLTQVIIVAGTIAVTLLGGLLVRRQRHADVEVTLSTEARAWVVEFKESARMASDSAAEANARAQRAEAQVRDCMHRMDTMERYIGQLVRVMHEHGITPPMAPVGLHRDQ